MCSFCLHFSDEFSHSFAREPCQKLISIKSTSDSIKLLLLVIDLIVRVCCAAAKRWKFDEKINRENMFLRWIKLRNEVKHWLEAKHNENLIRFLSLRVYGMYGEDEYRWNVLSRSKSSRKVPWLHHCWLLIFTPFRKSNDKSSCFSLLSMFLLSQIKLHRKINICPKTFYLLSKRHWMRK